jgi:DNA-binding LytR/AlgR family response regulator
MCIVHVQQIGTSRQIAQRDFYARLAARQFLRIHKSFLVAFDAIESIEGAQLKIGNDVLPVSKAYRAEVMARVEERMLRR